jgi:CBS domain-containing protein
MAVCAMTNRTHAGRTLAQSPYRQCWAPERFPAREIAMLISDVLHSKGHEVVTIRPDQTVKEAVERLASNRIGAIVVEERLKPIGIFSERDLVNRLARSGAAAYDYKVSELMTSPIISALPTDTIEHALGIMVSRRIRHLPILRNGDLAGMVSIGDLVKHRLDQKELEANTLLDIARMRA